MISRADWWLTTERLALRRFRPDDLDWLCALTSDPNVMRYVGGTKTREQAKDMLDRRMLEYYAQHPGLGIWATIERSTGACLGMHLLNHIQGETFIQVGYILSREAWGRGIATEMARALVSYGFRERGLAQVVAITALENVASQRVLEKAGLRRHGERAFAHPAYASQGPLAWFECDRDEWRPTEAPHDRR